MGIKASPYTILFWHAQKKEPQRTDFNIIVDQRITGPLDVERLRRALYHLVKDYILFNSHLVSHEGELFWEENAFISELELLEDGQQNSFVHRPLPWDTGPLYRFALFKIQEHVYDLVLIIHHALVDGTGANEAISLLSSYYHRRPQALSHADQARLLSHTHHTLEDRLAGLRSLGAEEFWRNTFKNFPSRVELPSFPSQNKGIGEYNFTVPTADVDIRLLKPTTLFRVLIGVYGVFLCQHTSRDKVSVPYPIRVNSGTQPFLFEAQINTAVLPLHLQEGVSLRALMKAMNAHFKACKKDPVHNYQNIPLADLLGCTPLSHLNVLFAQTNLKNMSLVFEGCRCVPQNRYAADLAGSDIALGYESTSSSLKFRLKYRKNLFPESYIKDYGQKYVRFLKEVLTPTHVDKALSSFPLLTPPEYEQVVVAWNKTENIFPAKGRTLLHLFEEQVKRTPKNIAAVFGAYKLTYEELNAETNQLAHALIAQHNIGPDTLVALYFERNLSMLIAILGVLKAGGAYVPIDPTYPPERSVYILEDTKAPLVLTQSSLEDTLASLTKTPLMLVEREAYIRYSPTPPTAFPRPHQRAYIIYTSGTTGHPKGVMIEHRGLFNFLRWRIETFDFDEKDVVLQRTPYVFDASVSEIFSPLVSGGRLIFIPQEDHTDVRCIHKALLHHQATKIHFVPSMFSVFMEFMESHKASLGKVNHIFLGGEVLSKKLLKRAKRLFPGVHFTNIYGPTETTIGVTYYTTEENTPWDQVPIGKLIHNMKGYVLDSHLSPLPVGMVGELHIGGEGVARGYLNTPELTAQKFIPHPFATEEDKAKGHTRLYKTGDLARWLPDGHLEYIGRGDSQVKLRGYRIELGEVESALLALEGVEQACVLVKERENNSYLIGYVVFKGVFDQDSLLDQLSRSLLGYMIPSMLVQLDAFPVTTTGKLDKKALPEPQAAQAETYVAPASHLEKEVCHIWTKILGVKRVGVTDNFFRRGGDSLLAVRMIHHISETLDYHITLRDIFEHKTIRRLCAHLPGKGHDHLHIPKVVLDVYPLSFAQERRFWNMERTKNDPSAGGHRPFLVGLAESVHLESLKHALQAVVRRHEILRTVYKKASTGALHQVVLQDPITIREPTPHNPQEQILSDIYQPFNVHDEYPIRVHLYKDPLGTTLLLNLHAIAADGWSTEILLRDVSAYYYHYKTGHHKIAHNKTEHQKTEHHKIGHHKIGHHKIGHHHSLDLPELPIQYKDYSVWQRNQLAPRSFAKQAIFWSERLKHSTLLNIKTDYKRPVPLDPSAEDVQFNLSRALSKEVRSFAQAHGYTLYTVLLCAFYLLLYRHTGQKDIILSTPTAGRSHQTRHLIGFFANYIPLRELLSLSQSVSDFLQQIHRHLIDAHHNQDIPFQQIIEHLSLTPDPSRHPLCQVMFSVQGFTQSKSSSPLFQASRYHVPPAPRSGYDLSVLINNSEERLVGNARYMKALFKRDTVQTLTDQYQALLREMIHIPPHTQLGELS